MDRKILILIILRFCSIKLSLYSNQSHFWWILTFLSQLRETGCNRCFRAVEPFPAKLIWQNPIGQRAHKPDELAYASCAEPSLEGNPTSDDLEGPAEEATK